MSGSGAGLSHVGPEGEARMVNVSDKPVTERVARAAGRIRMRPETVEAIRANTIAKGDVLGTARIAGVLAAKRTADLIPLCHPVPLTDVQVSLVLDDALPGIRCEATARAVARTGVEMEAMTAVAVSLITVYDMAKAIDRGMSICEIELLEKSGGRSGQWTRA